MMLTIIEENIPQHTSEDIEAQANISNPEDWLPDVNTIL
jgi:hypothetical protein